MELKKVTTDDLPINRNPFIAFEIVDKTLPYYNDRHVNRHNKKYVAYVNPSVYVMTIANWGTQTTTDRSFTLKSTSSDSIQDIKPEELHHVTVSLFVRIN